MLVILVSNGVLALALPDNVVKWNIATFTKEHGHEYNELSDAEKEEYRNDLQARRPETSVVVTKRKAGKTAQADVAATWNHIIDAVRVTNVTSSGPKLTALHS